MSNFELEDLVLSRQQIEVLKARERYDRGGFGKPGVKATERRYVNFKLYLYRKYPTPTEGGKEGGRG